MKKKMEEWEVKDAYETLKKAKVIEADDELMAKVTKLAENEKDTVKSIADLRKKYDDLVMAKDEDEMPKKVGIKKEKDVDTRKVQDDLPITDMSRKGYKEVKKEELENGELDSEAEDGDDE